MPWQEGFCIPHCCLQRSSRCFQLLARPGGVDAMWFGSAVALGRGISQHRLVLVLVLLGCELKQVAPQAVLVGMGMAWVGVPVWCRARSRRWLLPWRRGAAGWVPSHAIGVKISAICLGCGLVAFGVSALWDGGAQAEGGCGECGLRGPGANSPFSCVRPLQK